MLKKNLALCMALFMLLSLMPLNTMAASGNLLFDLDLSGTTSENIATANSVPGNETLLTVHETVTSGVINSSPYLTFDTVDVRAKKSSVKVEDPSFENLDNMTAEFWMNIENVSGWQEVFNLTTDNAESAYTFNMALSGTSLYYRPDGQKTSSTITLPKDTHRNTWIHVAVTRTWNVAPGSKGTVNSTIYINGEEKGTITGTNKEARRSQTGQYLMLGGAGNSLQGSIADFKLYDNALDEDEINRHYMAEQTAYIIYPDTMEVESISKPVADPSVPEPISKDTDSITINFNNYVDASTAQEGIKFLMENGDEIPGGSHVTVPSSFSKTATVKYGKLAVGESYKLVINDSLKSLNGVSAIPEEYHYTVSSDKLFSINFTDEEDYIVGSNPPVQDGFTYTSKGVKESAETITVKSENGMKFLSVSDGGVEKKDNFIFWTPAQPVSASTVVVDIKMRPHSEGGNFCESISNEIMRIYSGSSYETLARVTKGFKVAARSTTAAKGSIIGHTLSGFTDSFTTRGSDGFYDLRFTFTKEGDYYKKVTINNLNSEIEGTATLTFPATSAISEITQFRIFHHYASPSETWVADDQSVQLARFEVSETKNPIVLHSNAADMDRTEDALTVVFSEEIVESSISDETFVLKDENGAVVPTELYDFDQTARKATIVMKEFLKENADYTLEVGSVRTVENSLYDIADYSFTTQSAKTIAITAGFTDADGETIEEFGADSIVKLKYDVINNSGSNISAHAVLVIYDGNNRIEKVIPGDAMITAVGGNVGVSTKVGDLTTAKKIRAFVWKEDVTQGALALAEPITLEAVQD